MTHYSSRELYLRLLGYVKPYWRIFVFALVTMSLSAATEPLFPALMKPLLDGHFGGGDAADLWRMPLLIVAIFVFRGLLGFVADYSLAWVSNKVVLDLRNAMFATLVRLPVRYVDNQSSGVLMSKVAYDVTGVTGAATGVLTTLVKDTLAVVGLLGWLLWLDWKLTLVALAMIPLIALAVGGFSKRLRRTSRGVQEAMGQIMRVLQETIEAHKVVKVFGGQDYEKNRFAQASGGQRAHAMRQTVAAAALGPIVQTLAAVALAVIIAFALRESAQDGATVGSFVSFITAMLMLLAPLKRLTDINAPLQRGLAAAESVFSLVDEKPEEDNGTVDLGRARGEVAFERLVFTYPDAPRRALDGIDLAIQPSETVALVGASGSGKTTLANLLPRFHPASGGRISVDGHDVAQLTLKSLRANIALVSQDVVLFNDTVAANIAYGALGSVDRETVRAAARAAHALEFIEAMPQGFDTLIGENGVKLSGGQRQRLAIARALLKDAPILILDEATSALDTQSERAVQEALEALMENRTTLVIAHRLSTIENADRIVVLQQGRIVESGRHDELLAREGAYAALYRMQRAEQQEAA
ncbi:lipid A export permease/ATP-binding protein MsbA [Denitratisoma sp. DHT3]|uniref:lipid A export permease/ATP-binding protein MsbA n=1 Tax=Denitratisoma sp. DHT3 TaxID=1981880 RepID=UPI001198AF33|nr:lipid A export permease/ATP-binding protein MsbA [Denitratisoma sp. DHT3]QDX81586.1 lipid A export permease/ATP-binding protein MsbA [Denitratisoma sp. DHT3]